MFNHLIKIIELIEKSDWNRAKTVLILLVSQIKLSNHLRFDLFDTEYNAFIRFFVKYQVIEFKCDDCGSETAENICNIVLNKENECETYLSLNRSELCESCLTISNGHFKFKPPFILVEVVHYIEQEKNILRSEIPLCINLDNTHYNFLFATIFNPETEHYRSIFRLNDSFYLIDDLSKTLKKISNNYKLCTLFYYLS